MKTPHIKTIDRSPLRASLLISFVLACLALSPQARAVCQEGCLTNQNTVLGDDALLNNTLGSSNTANGFNALFSNTSGSDNTSTGVVASLYSNTGGSFNTSTAWSPSTVTQVAVATRPLALRLFI
jgi:hypothetical protein